jgi:hypothetical protein
LILLQLLGCQAFKTKSMNPLEMFAKEKQEVEPEEQTPAVRPVKLVAVWKDATLTGSANAQAIRGFAGRVYFFDAKEQPIKVNGEFVVYAFDDSVEAESKEAPNKKFVITAENLAQKHSTSEIGSSYSIWLPWDAVGGERKSISLVPMLRSTEGWVLRGEAANAVLPGKKPDRINEREDFMKHFRQTVANNGVTPASFSTDEPSKGSVEKMRTTSIALPKSLSAKMKLNSTEQLNQRYTTETDLQDPSLHPVGDLIPAFESPAGAKASFEAFDGAASPISAVVAEESRYSGFQRIPIKPISGPQ